MSSRKNHRLSKHPAVDHLQVKSEPDLNEKSTKKRKENSQSSMVSNEVDEPKSCPQCHRNLLVSVTERSNPCPVCCKEIEANNKVAAGYGWICESDNPHATVQCQEGLWHGHVVGQPEKHILHAVEDRYPQTFQGVENIPKPYRVYTLRALHDFITTFLHKSVHQLEKDDLTNLETEIDFFEKIGFGLSWARNRIQMVRNLKFGNDPLKLELVKATARTERAQVEFERVQKECDRARVECARATVVRDQKLHEMTQKYGVEYDDVLNGELGFGMLP